MLALCGVGLAATFLEVRGGLGTTAGVPYDKVQAQVGQPIERYECPAAVVARRLRRLERGVIKTWQHEAARPPTANEVARKKLSLAAPVAGFRLNVRREAAAHLTHAGASRPDLRPEASRPEASEGEAPEVEASSSQPAGGPARRRARVAPEPAISSGADPPVSGLRTRVGM